jgi:hypothetical protein
MQENQPGLTTSLDNQIQDDLLQWLGGADLPLGYPEANEVAYETDFSGHDPYDLERNLTASSRTIRESSTRREGSTRRLPSISIELLKNIYSFLPPRTALDKRDLGWTFANLGARQQNHIKVSSADELAQAVRTFGAGGLEKITANAANLNDGDLIHITSLPIKELMLAGNNITSEGVASLNSMLNLTHLDLSNNEITSEGVAALNLIPNLKHLKLSQNLLDTSGLVSCQVPCDH